MGVRDDTAITAEAVGKNALLQERTLKPKILFLDEETFPNVGYTWRKFEQNVIEFITHTYMLSFAYQWWGESKIHFESRQHQGEKALLKKLWKLLDQADIVVAHNGSSFDLPFANTAFLRNGFPPPSPFKLIDTLTIARKFRFNANNLDDICRDVGLGRKVHHEGFPLWLACHNNDPEAWVKMERYNKQDVALLVKLFEKLHPWISTMNLNVITGKYDSCPNCMSKRVKKNGMQYNKTGAYQRFVCLNCHAHIRGRSNKIPKTGELLRAV